MAEILFTRGQFQVFRVVTAAGLHLGQIPPNGKSLMQGDEIEFDGQFVRIGTEQFSIPNVKGAITSGWLVPADSPMTTYVPKPAGVSIKAAVSRGQDRGVASVMGVVANEETQVSSLKTANLGQRDGKMVDERTAQGGKLKMQVVNMDNQDAVPVARVKSSTDTHVLVKDRLSAEREINALSSPESRRGSEGVEDVRPRVSSVGCIASDNDAGLFPDAAVAGGIVKRGIVAPVALRVQAATPVVQEALTTPIVRIPAGAAFCPTCGRPLTEVTHGGAAAVVAPVVHVEASETSTPAPVEIPVEAPIEAPIASEVAPEPVKVAVAPRSKVSMLTGKDGKFPWDFAVQWKQRYRLAIDKYGSDPVALQSIMDNEMEAVRTRIQAELVGKAQ